MVFAEDWYILYVFAPSVLSCLCSILLVINVIVNKLQKYFFHQMSVILALCDIVQCMGIFLDSPWTHEYCYPAAYFFLVGSLYKILTIMYITGVITYVIRNLEAPSKQKKIIFLCCQLFLALIATIVLPATQVAEILCFDPDPVTLNYDDVSHMKRRMFFVFYALPISFFFTANLILTVYGSIRLSKMARVGDANKSLLRLLRRLLPFSSIFSIAFLPSAIFFLRGYLTGHENIYNKIFAILGQVLSGTFYAISYTYFCYMDYTYVAAATKRILAVELSNGGKNKNRNSSINFEDIDEDLENRLSTISAIGIKPIFE